MTWRDLVGMRLRDGVVECLHPLPWLAGSIALASVDRLGPAALCSFMFFLTALRLNHEAIHRNLGFGAKASQLVLHGLSFLMLGSNSAVRDNHLRHHRHIGRSSDIEGKAGRMSFLGVIAYGPLFPVELHWNAWRNGGRRLRQRMVVDLLLNILAVGLAFGLDWPPLHYHLFAMTLAQMLTALFAVWITHRQCDGDLAARTQRSRLVNLLSYNMFLHLEHHMFPAVPVKRLGRLAARLDTAAPELAERAGRVLPLPPRLAIRLRPQSTTG